MAPVYADHPFPLIKSPEFTNKQNGTETDMFDHCASEMACVHNLLIRGLNAIYLQALYIKPADEKSFVNYILTFSALLHAHHTGEEVDFFPTVEAMAGEKGMMEANVEQHHAFHDPLEAFDQYIKAIAAGQDKYDGKKVVGLIDAFGPALMQHLADEIPTIQGLRKYGDKMADLQKKFDEEGEKNMVRDPINPVRGERKKHCCELETNVTFPGPEESWTQRPLRLFDHDGPPLRRRHLDQLAAHAGCRQLPLPQRYLVVCSRHRQVRSL